VAGSCDDGNEHLGITAGREFLNQLSDYQYLKKNFAA
jgi:hypothetical protein